MMRFFLILLILSPMLVGCDEKGYVGELAVQARYKNKLALHSHRVYKGDGQSKLTILDLQDRKLDRQLASSPMFRALVWDGKGHFLVGIANAEMSGVHTQPHVVLYDRYLKEKARYRFDCAIEDNNLGIFHDFFCVQGNNYLAENSALNNFTAILEEERLIITLKDYFLEFLLDESMSIVEVRRVFK